MTTLPTTRLPKPRVSVQPPQAPAQLPRPAQIAMVMFGLLLVMLVSSLLAQLM